LIQPQRIAQMPAAFYLSADCGASFIVHELAQAARWPWVQTPVVGAFLFDVLVNVGD